MIGGDGSGLWRRGAACKPVVAPRAYVGTEHARSWLKSEIFMTSEVIDRSTQREFEETGEKDSRQRAEGQIEEILSKCEPREFDPDRKRELDAIMLRHAQKYGMGKLPTGD